MAYGWNIQNLRDSLTKLGILINNTTNLEDKYYYVKVYGETLEILDRFVTNAKPYRKPNIDEQVQDLLGDSYSSKCWYSLIEEVYKRFEVVDDFTFNATQAIQRVYGNGSNFVFNPNGHISHDGVIDMTKDFYSGFDSELYDYFKVIYDRRYTAFDFISLNEKKVKKRDGDQTSECWFIGGVNDFFINIMDKDGIAKYIDTVHEAGHVIEFLMNPRICYNDNTNYFSEVASIFPELVAHYEGFHSSNNDEYIYHFFCSLAAILDDMASLIDHDLIVGNYIDNNYRVNNAYFRKLKRDFDISKKDFHDALEKKIDRCGTYVTSTGIALELFHIYKQDKRKALELFKKILRVNNDCNINASIMNLVPFGDGMVEELSSFKDEFSLVLDRKGVKL